MKALIVLIFIIVISLFFSVYKLPSSSPLVPPNLEYPLGTYINGQNMININAIAIVNTFIFGTIVGIIEILLATIYGIFSSIGRKTRIIMVRFLDALTIIPRVPFLLAIALFYGTPEGTFLKANFFITAIIIALTGWSNYARQISENLYFSTSIPLLSRIIGKLSFSLLVYQYYPSLLRLTRKFFIPAIIDGISTYTAMGVIAGVGDPNYPTLTTLLNTSRLLPDWWLFLIPAIFRGIVIVILYIISDSLR
jgi:peptide/nickel transport system permease protein